MDERDRNAQELLNRSLAMVERWGYENALVEVCDFCCHPVPKDEQTTYILDSRIVSEVTGITEELGAASGAIVFSEDWMACRKCAPVVDRRDPTVLADHAVKNRDVVRVGEIHNLDATTRDLTELYEHFFSLNPRRQECTEHGHGAMAVENN